MTTVKNESWTVTTEDENSMETLRSFTVDSEKDAKQLASEWAAKFVDESVFVEYFRKSDGQKMYLNVDGYDVTGKRWNN